MELLQLNVAQMATYGINIGVPQLVLTLLANIKTATTSKYGHEFHSAMHAICKKYTYNHVHDAASLQTILTELASADGVRVLNDAPAPSAGMAHSMADSVSFLHSMMDGGDTNSEYTESAYGATSTSVLNATADCYMLQHVRDAYSYASMRTHTHPQDTSEMRTHTHPQYTSEMRIC